MMSFLAGLAGFRVTGLRGVVNRCIYSFLDPLLGNFPPKRVVGGVMSNRFLKCKLPDYLSQQKGYKRNSHDALAVTLSE
ncbi:MAG: hypothetical protein ACLPWS_17375 [Rhodomicrobium sp.]